MTTADRCFEPAQGTHKNLTLEQALTRILSAVSPIPETERVALTQANGRTLAEQLHAAIDLPLMPGQIYDSKRYMLQALLDTPGISGIDMGIVRDDPETLKATLLSAGEQADAIITSGGVSAGDADHVVNMVEKTGKIEFWKVAIKPGKPCAFGRIGHSWFFGLPGNPVAVWVVFAQLVRPALDKLSGAGPRFAPRFKASCVSTLKKAPGRIEFQRGVLRMNSDGLFEVESTGEQGSDRISSVSRANCYIALPPENSGVAPGETVDVELIGPFL